MTDESFPTEKIRVTKLDAARRQLRTAIQLWFADGDPVAIHALSFAAHEIIHRLYRKKGLKNLVFDSHLIKEEYRKEFLLRLKEDAAFFKHAERDADPNAEIVFNPWSNVLFLCTCMVGLQRMGEKLGDVEDAFLFWLGLHKPGWVHQDVAQERIPVESLDKLRAMDKGGFFEAYLQVRREHRTSGTIE